MADGGEAFSARMVSSIDGIGRDVWDRLANPDPATHNPFVSYDFLKALEDSQSVGGQSGWAPSHLAVEQAGAVIGVAPVYAKAHSQGEYVFDHHWADAYERAGGRYYPKLVCAAPFTPAPGPRLLARDPTARAALAAALIEATKRVGASSLHANFLTADDQDALTAAGALPRLGEQYHWFNRGYRTYDEFLDPLSSRKRKAIRRERREAAESGLRIRRLQGEAIEERHWDAMWMFYQDTGARKWGRPYLTRTFFRLIGERMAGRILLILAFRGETPVAGALNFIGGDALYGRYWGCIEDHPFLHFELCYHQAIDYAIEQGLDRVEAGAQGEHKIARGYEPVATCSAHWIADSGFRVAIERYLESERAHIQAEIESLSEMTPFKKG